MSLYWFFDEYFVLSHTVSETSDFYNTTNKGRVKLEVLDAPQTCFDGEACDQNSFLEVGCKGLGFIDNVNQGSRSGSSLHEVR